MSGVGDLSSRPSQRALGGSARGYQDLREELTARQTQFPALLAAYLYIAIPEVDILICRRRRLPGLPWRWHSRPSCCRTGLSPLAVKLIAGHGACDGREKLRPGRPDAARLEGGLRLPGRCLEAPGDPGPEKGCQPGIIQGPGLRQAAKPRNVAVEPASAFPVAGAQQRTIVSGVTSSRSPWRRALGITPGRALPAQFSFGRHGCRRCGIASWWRRIKISTVRQTSSRRDSRSHVTVRVIRRKTNRRHMTGDHHGEAAGMASLLAIAADGILGTHRI
jgi:hypothetical protein